MAAETPDGQEKTEDASAKKLTDARDKGQVAKSMEIATAAMLLLGGWAVFAFGSSMIDNMMSLMTFMLREAGTIELSEQSIPIYFLRLVLFLGSTLLPVLLVLAVIGTAAEVAQVGFHFATKKFTEGLNFQSVLNPFVGIKRIFFTAKSYIDVLKNIGKVLLLLAVLYNVLADKIDTVAMIMQMPFRDLAAFMAQTGFEMVLHVGAVYMAIAAFDYFMQRKNFKTDMKMTKQESKEENKQQEGDVQMKQRIRAIARQRLRKVMLSRIKEADVIITNPTHYAVAIKYKQGEMGAPLVLAKGLDFLALKIREVATKEGVPIVEDPPLARAIYAACEPDQEIPEQLFKAVAQVLAYVYRLKKR